MTRLLKSAPPLAHDRVVMDYDQRLMRRKLLTSAGGRMLRVLKKSVHSSYFASRVLTGVATKRNRRCNAFTVSRLRLKRSSIPILR